MSTPQTTPEIRSVTVERDLPFPPEKVWRALTQPHLLAEWLMQSDFAPEVKRPFRFTADWGHVDGRVLRAEPPHTLAYTWDAFDLKSTVTFTLSPTDAGTRLTVEQVGFRPHHDQAFHGARFGWTRNLGKLEEVLAGLD